MKYYHQVKAVVAGLILSSSVVPLVSADDTEIYTSSSVTSSSSNPNIMFIVDTSGSMGSSSRSWVKPSYDADVTYTANAPGAGQCVSTGVYYVDDGQMPNCANALTNYFNYTALECDHAVVQYTAAGAKVTGSDTIGSLLRVGTYSDQLAQYDTDANPDRWRALSIGSSSDRDFTVECFSDNGNSSANGNNNEYIADNGGDGYSDVSALHPVWAGGAGNLQLFAGNYVNYTNWIPSTNTDPALGVVELVEKTYLEQVKSAINIMVRGNTRVDIGLMRFDSDDDDADGGSISYPIRDVGASRVDFFNRLDGLNANGYTPLSEVYYEALLYFGGRDMDFSQLAAPGNQITSVTEMPGNKKFRSPITGSCDKNYIVLLSDGKPKKDDVNETRQEVLPGFPKGSCSTNVTASSNDDNRDSGTAPGTASTVDNCLDELSQWAATHDVVSINDPGIHAGDQFITTHTIGFGLNDAGAVALMTSAAENGGGEFYTTESEAGLIAIFDKIIAAALDVNTTFSSPAVSVNAFNRSTHLDDLYFTLFRPSYTKHWPGNLKKYKLKFYTDINDDDGDGDTTEKLPFIADRDGANAVAADTGFFSTTARSYWSATPDGDDVREGGVVSVLNASRNVYTYTGAYADTGTTGVKTPPAANADLTGSANVVQTTNDDLTNTLLGFVSKSPIVGTTAYRDTLINWAKGLDALSDFGVADTYGDQRPQMGDPLHSEPALIQYGLSGTEPDLVIYTATNDGYLHAFSSVTGLENFAFIPQELLPNLSRLMENPDGTKIYGLDGSVAAWINDANDDNAITTGASGDHAYIYVSMRRGGNNIYALDVTSKSSPRLMWVIKGGVGAYAELGDTWSTVNVEKIKDGTTEKTVLIFGGGYDTSQDSALVKTADTKGRAVFIADATTGERLWVGGSSTVTPAISPNTAVANMDYSIPARIKPLDVSGDGFIDRLYAADMGGQIFRFDINNTNDAALSTSITGARIASLAGATDVDARRFYYPPDVATVSDASGKYDALVISSGYRAHPLNTTIHDRIYMIKDKQTAFTTTYTTDVVESDLKNVTLNIAGGDGGTQADRDDELVLIQAAEGWYINLSDEFNSDAWVGEKGLSEALLLEGVAVVTTYTPNVQPAENTCGPSLGLGKVFYLDILDATPAFPTNVDARLERHTQLIHSGIPPSPNIIVPDGGDPCIAIGATCTPPPLGLGTRKTYWYEEEK